MDNVARILALIAQNSGSGGTEDYTDLINKPSINGVTLVGEISLGDLKLNAIWVGTTEQYNHDRDTIEDGTLVIITDDDVIDSVPTENSENLVTSGGVYAFIQSTSAGYLPLSGGTMTGAINLDEHELVIDHDQKVKVYYNTSDDTFLIKRDDTQSPYIRTSEISIDSDRTIKLKNSNSSQASGNSNYNSIELNTVSGNNGIIQTAYSSGGGGRTMSTIEQAASSIKQTSIDRNNSESSIGVNIEGVDIKAAYGKRVNIGGAETNISGGATGNINITANGGRVNITAANTGTDIKGYETTVEATGSSARVTLKHTNNTDPIKVQRQDGNGNLATYDNIDSGNLIENIPEEHIELTQAEYDRLPASKYTDNKNYFITDAEPDNPTYIYGFHIDPDESDPSDRVTYLEDAAGMQPASMGATSFNYGSWANAFFMPKPCMLKYDGTVDYYLDPNDFTKKVDGTASDVGNINYAGNAMMEFPKIWFKFEAGTADGEGYFYVSNQKVDDTYRCWCNMDADGNEIDYFYVHIYNGVIYDGKMRSLSGMKLSSWSTTAYSSSATYAVNSIVNYDGKMWKCVTAVETAEAFDSTKWEQFAFNGNTDGTQEVNSATANNTTVKSEWYIDTWCDRVLITALLYLMGKSLNLQGAFGRGIDSGSQSAAESYVTGAANDKGLFYGSTSNGNTVVKVFGIENFWACKWHRTAGLIGNSSGGYSYKMTVSTTDGSSVSGYNSNGNGYLTTTFNRPPSNYVKLMAFGAHGTLPLDTTGATSTTFYCNYFYTGTGYALVGGGSNLGADCGFYVYLCGAFGGRYWSFAAALSCKPLAQKG